jgi:hypothetical protein
LRPPSQLIAPDRPAEFVIFRLRQWTAEARR